MNLKNFYIAPIKGYQYISKMLPANCRYYPTCSEYAKWQFEFNAPPKAFWATSKRILSCNQLFAGGIDYPLVEMNLQRLSSILTCDKKYDKTNVIFWFIPQSIINNKINYYIIKSFDAINRST